LEVGTVYGGGGALRTARLTQVVLTMPIYNSWPDVRMLWVLMAFGACMSMTE